MISRYPGLRNLLADQIANHIPTRASTGAFELEDCGGAQVTITRKYSSRNVKLCRVWPLDNDNQRGRLSGAGRSPLTRTRCVRLVRPNLQKPRVLAPDVVNHWDDLSERS